MKFIVSIALLLCIASPALANGAFTLSSPELKAGTTIPNKHIYNSFGCEGDNIPVSLIWENPPKGTKSFAITVYDPAAPTGSGWWHWVTFNIPATARGIYLDKAIVEKNNKYSTGLPKGSVESLTDFGAPGYGGPCPPAGDKKHPYIFTVHALDVESLDLPATSMPALVGFTMSGHRLGKAEFTLYYGR